MQAMQMIQPEVKRLQKQFKGDRQRLNEETMKLYKTHGVNPFSGCLPLLLQFPILIALFQVLRVPGGEVHIPKDSKLREAIVRQDTNFAGTNLLCSASQAGQTVHIAVREGQTNPIGDLDCGHGAPVRIPYYVFLAAMIGTTYYQQRQMQKASPGPVNQQQQLLSRIMPAFFGFIGFGFPAGLVLYWTTTNFVQIGQQAYMLSRGMVGQRPPAGEPGERVEKKDGGVRDRRPGSGAGGRTRPRSTDPKRRGGDAPQRKSRDPKAGGSSPNRNPKGGAGGQQNGDRKKRRKR
jgi:YidC/Oxa1 family membrane protein insertase